MIVAEFRDLIVATYSELLPSSWDPTRWTFTGTVGGPCGPSAVLRPQALIDANIPRESTNIDPIKINFRVLWPQKKGIRIPIPANSLI
jgi:hypothetical protein